MPLPTGVNRKYAVLAGFTLGLAWLWFAFDRPQIIPTHIIWNASPNGSHTNVPPPTLDQHDVFDFPHVNSDVMKAVCSMQEWNSSIIFTCDSNQGGVGHVRNSILNCVRYAIGAGGSLVMPNIKLREDIEGMNMMPMEEEEQHLGKRHGLGWKGLDYMFDADHFKKSLRMSCPELNIIDHMEQTVNSRRRGLLPESLFINRPTSGLEHPEEWHEKLHAWIDKWMAPTPQSTPVVVDLEQSNLQYPTHADGHVFAHEFGQIMKFRPDVRRLATSTLRQMSSWYDVPLNVSATIVKPSFLGVHLKTEPEADASEAVVKRHVTAAPFMHYDGQAEAYIALAKSMKTPIIYAASGDIDSTHKLAAEAKSHGIDVTHKEDLLKEHEREELSHLRWDQRALIDYLVVLRGEYFAGVGHSLFSWNVMLKRHESALLKQKLHDDIYADDLSSLYGVRESYLDSAKCMWA